MERKKIEYLVVDTSAFIKNAPVQDLGANVITCQDVVNEVTSKRQIRRLVVLPYDITIKDVFPENVKFVSEFAKKTGDYLSLSATDIKVIALTYQLEKEIVGSSHLNQTPELKRSINLQNRPVVELKDTVGFYIPSKAKKSASDDPESHSNAEDDPSCLSTKLSSLQCSESDEMKGDHSLKTPVQDVTDSLSIAEINPSNVLVEISKTVIEGEKKSSSENVGNSQFKDNMKELDEGEDIELEDTEEEEGDSDVEDEDEGWITPSNIKEMKRQINAEFEEEKDVQVACLTTDFAMQNVLKQIGLNVSSIEGRIIRQMRTFILRCYACFKTTSVMTKIFCPHCGHKTLKRVAVTVEPDGSQKIHINAKKRITTKGKNVSLPMFQGGKHSNNPIIFADQPVPDQKPTRIARTKTNILDGDYIPGFSPFALRDTTSKSAMLGIRSKETKHWMRNGTHSSRKKK